MLQVQFRKEFHIGGHEGETNSKESVPNIDNNNIEKSFFIIKSQMAIDSINSGAIANSGCNINSVEDSVKIFIG